MLAPVPFRLRFGLLALSLGLLALPGSAQEMAVPVGVQVPLFLKILAFDRNLMAQSGPLVLGIVYQGKYRSSANAADEARRATKGVLSPGAGGLPLKVVLLDLDGTPDLGEALARLKVRVIYVSPLRAIDLRSIRDASRSGGIRSLTGVTRYVDDGLGIGIDLKGDRPEILVNLEASRAEGGDLDAQLLKLARIVQ